MARDAGLVRRGMHVLKNEGIAAFAKKAARHMRKAPAEQPPQPACDVLFVNGCDLSVPHPTRYRVYHQMEQLELLGYACRQVYYIDARPEDVSSARCILLFRAPYTDTIAAMIDRAHQEGKKVFFDVDDLVIDTAYTDQLSFVGKLSPEDKKIFDDGVMRTGKTLSLCDGAIGSTDCIAHEMENVLPKTYVNRNVASQKMVELSEEARRSRHVADDSVILGYFSGSLTHNADFALISDVLCQLLRSYPSLRFAVTGVSEIPEELKPYEGQIIRKEYVPWKELPKLIASVDINLVPLEDTLFNHAKSENKWVDASLVGVPTVASRVEPYKDIVQHGKTGFLCATTEEWIAVLSSLIEDAGLREQVGNAAHEFCMMHCTTRNTGFHLAEILCGQPPTIEAILKSRNRFNDTEVHDYLASRQIVLPQVNLDKEPWNRRSMPERKAALQEAAAAGKKTAIILYEMTSGDTPTFRYFGYNPVMALMDSPSWHAEYFYVSEIEEVRGLLPQLNLLVLMRMRERPDVVELVNEAHAHQIPVSYLIDDDVVGREKADRIYEAMDLDESDDFGHAFWEGFAVRCGYMAEACDSFLVPVPYFADLLRKEHGKPCYVLHSSLNREQMDIASAILPQAKAYKVSSHPFTVGYFSGTASHAEDFALVEPALVQLMDEHPDTRLVLAGRFTLSDKLLFLWQEGRVTLLPFMDYLSLQAVQASVDVILAPLVLDEFTNCKSALKVFEAGICGTPACASPSSSLKEAIEDGRSGFICGDSEEWHRHLEALAEDPALLASLSEGCIAAAQAYSPVALEKEAEAVFAQAASAVPRKDMGMMHAASRTEDAQLDWDNAFAINPLYSSR